MGLNTGFTIENWHSKTTIIDKMLFLDIHAT